MCYVLHCLKTRLVLSANQNAGLQCKRKLWCGRMHIGLWFGQLRSYQSPQLHHSSWGLVPHWSPCDILVLWSTIQVIFIDAAGYRGSTFIVLYDPFLLLCCKKNVWKIFFSPLFFFFFLIFLMLLVFFV